MPSSGQIGPLQLAVEMGIQFIKIALYNMFWIIYTHFCNDEHGTYGKSLTDLSKRFTFYGHELSGFLEQVTTLLSE